MQAVHTYDIEYILSIVHTVCLSVTCEHATATYVFGVLCVIHKSSLCVSVLSWIRVSPQHHCSAPSHDVPL